MRRTSTKATSQYPPTLRVLRQRLVQIARETPGQVQRAAAYAAANPEEIIFSTTRDFARLCSVSPATVIRMARALGFCGFRSFREAVRNACQNPPVPPAPAGAPPQSTDNFLTSFSSIQTRDLGLNATRLNQIAERIMSANTVFVVGFRSPTPSPGISFIWLTWPCPISGWPARPCPAPPSILPTPTRTIW